MKKPDCKCFAPGVTNGEAIINDVGIVTTDYFIRACRTSGVCVKAGRLAVVNTIISLMDMIVCFEENFRNGRKPEHEVSDARSRELFDEWMKTLPDELRSRRDQLEAIIAGVGVTRQ